MIDPREYSPSVAELLRETPLAPLGPGRPAASMRAKLSALTDESFAPRVADRRMAAACRAGLWLAFDFLDESHALSQEIETAEGSFWHGILHRREPDAGNSKYWFRRVGDHPVFAELAKDAVRLGYAGAGASWDPFTFIDQCEEHRGTGSELEMTLRKVQRREWELLFDWCFRRVG